MTFLLTSSMKLFSDFVKNFRRLLIFFEFPTRLGTNAVSLKSLTRLYELLDEFLLIYRNMVWRDSFNFGISYHLLPSVLRLPDRLDSSFALAPSSSSESMAQPVSFSCAAICAARMDILRTKKKQWLFNNMSTGAA